MTTRTTHARQIAAAVAAAIPAMPRVRFAPHPSIEGVVLHVDPSTRSDVTRFATVLWDGKDETDRIWVLDLEMI